MTATSSDMDSPIVTLTTDFGWRDSYVGSMKGAVLSINRSAHLVDLTHDVPPHDIAHAAFVIAGASATFPPDTVHVCVVDPGVGTERSPILLVTPSGRFVAPDNGVLTLVMAEHCDRDGVAPSFDSGAASVMQAVPGGVPAGLAAYTLDRPRYWRHSVSDTFHGRDVFGPVAAHLTLGVGPEKLGSPLDELVWLNYPQPKRNGTATKGSVVYIDGFGNLVTNIPASALARGAVVVDVEGARIAGLSHSYAGNTGLVAIIGSHGYLEIAERNGSAAARLETGVGSAVRVTAED